MKIALNPVDRVDVLTLQDNYIDLVAQDNSEVLQPSVYNSNALLRAGGSAAYRKGDARLLFIEYVRDQDDF